MTNTIKNGVLAYFARSVFFVFGIKKPVKKKIELH